MHALPGTSRSPGRTPHGRRAAMRTVLAGLALLCALAPAVRAAPSSVPVEAFFGEPAMSEPTLSPDGSALAVLVRGKSGRRRLAIIDTRDLLKVKIAASFSDNDVAQVQWVNDRRLVFELRQEELASNQQRNGSGLVAVDRDGQNMVVLVRQDWETDSGQGRLPLGPEYGMLRTLADGSDDVVVVRRHFGRTTGFAGRYHADFVGETPMRLNTRTGFPERLLERSPPRHVWDWVVDDQGRVAAALAVEDGESTFVVPDAHDGWTVLRRFPAFVGSDDSHGTPRIAANGQMYVSKYTPEPDSVAALYRMDAATGELDAAPVLVVKGFDFAGRPIGDRRTHRLLGVSYVADAAATLWFDPEMKALQARIDARLPGRVNQLDIARCGCSPRVLVTSSSDRDPERFLLYDRDADRLLEIGRSRPAIDPAEMAETDFERIRARDGHDLPVYVTRPQGKGPWPAVVLVHGGPNVRGWDWGWDAESQFLASRGFVVVKPEFRGSSGYGRQLEVSGFKQWGLGSQDDIADATSWAVGQGLADSKRICIAGASYGGYAALMGLVRYGDMYRCGVAWAAVTDIGLMYDLGWSDASDGLKTYGMPARIGDPVEDAAQFAATSPLKQAARITRPLLLAHGGVDVRVPIEHAQRLRDALLKLHAPLTWLEYDQEAHGWDKPQTRFDFYTKMEEFLDANIGPGAAAHTR
jgi:dipeptidyl aminopeptidase/acylaminoacyl peptidase